VTATPAWHLAGFGVRIAGQPKQFGEFRVIRRLAATIGLLAGLAPAWAYAQTNIDQGKTPAQIFAAACAECHKATRALASGKNSGTLTDFLQEHYTTSRAQAAALAAYVLSTRGAESGAASAQGRGQKPAAAHAAAPAEESKPAKQQAQQPGKPEEATPATAKLHQQRPATATRNHRREPNAPPSQEPAAVAHEPAAVVAEPAAPTEPPSRETSPAPAAAAAPADAASGENAPVLRDNIPD
jgi:hypothetical protein